MDALHRDVISFVFRDCKFVKLELFLAKMEVIGFEIILPTEISEKQDEIHGTSF